MRHTITCTLTLAAACVVAIPVAASAQDTVRTESRGEVAIRPAFASLVTSIDATVLTTDRIKQLDKLKTADVRIVDTRTIVTPADQKAFDAALERNKGYLDGLRAVIRTNAVLSRALADDAARPGANDVVAAEVGPDSKVTLYVHHAM